MSPLTGGARVKILAAGVAGLLAGTATPVLAQPAPACSVADPCTKPRRPGEVAIVLLGDSGYGEGGASEWGGHSQAAVAQSIEALCPRPDLVFFLGDNIYWGGSPDLFGPRFDTMYRNLFDADHRRVHAALGNHDVKGCQVAREPGYAAGQSCLDALERAVREDVRREGTPASGAVPSAQANEAGILAARWLAPEVRERAMKVPLADCPSAFDAGYEQSQAEGGACYASAALRHTEFGYARRGEIPLRYYTVDWPSITEGADTREPRVRVLVADSNTLDVAGGLLTPPTPANPAPPKPPGTARTDELQLLWMENQLRTAPEGSWKITLMHHPVYSPRGCAFRLLGKCVGGHDDEQGMKAQLHATWGAGDDERSNGTHHPDLVFTAHNHFYARTRAVDGLGYPTTEAKAGVRYFVTGGGGAPLYRQQPLHARYAAGGSFHHFVYLRLQPDVAFFWAIDDRGQVKDSGCFRREDPIDRCITQGTFKSATLACGEPPSSAGACAPVVP